MGATSCSGFTSNPAWISRAKFRWSAPLTDLAWPLSGAGCLASGGTGGDWPGSGVKGGKAGDQVRAAPPSRPALALLQASFGQTRHRAEIDRPIGGWIVPAAASLQSSWRGLGFRCPAACLSGTRWAPGLVEVTAGAELLSGLGARFGGRLRRLRAAVSGPNHADACPMLTPAQPGSLPNDGGDQDFSEMENRGLEPLTSAVRLQRSTS